MSSASRTTFFSLPPLSLVTLLALSGCYPKGDGDRLAQQASDLEARVTAIESAGFTERFAAADEKLVQLQEVLEQATAVVRRNSADLGTEVQELRAQLQAAEGLIAEVQQELRETQRGVSAQNDTLEQRVLKIARRAGIDLSVSDNEVPADQAEHYRVGMAAIQGSEPSRGRALLREYVSRYPQADNADNAQFAIGKSFLDQERPANALAEFRRIISDYRQGDQVPATLFYMGEAFVALHSCDDARQTFQALIQAYASDPRAGQARERIRALQSDSSCN